MNAEIVKLTLEGWEKEKGEFELFDPP